MDAREARTEFEAGRLPTEQLLELLERQERLIQRLHTEVERLKQRLAQYEPDIRQESTPTEPAQAPPSASYSLDAEERRRRPRHRRRKSPGRRPTQLKFAEAQCFEDIYPDDLPPADCQLLRERAVWRLRDGRAVRVGYRIFGRPGSPEPAIPGVTPRCEYGIEILVVLAFLVYVIGLSLDKTCAVLAFFCQLPLAKSQADALLRQLAHHWEGEFDLLCALLAHAAVVYMDETGWKVGNEGCALWTFASAGQRVFLFGCHKDAATLDAMLPPEVFHGIGVSDDAAVYRDRFEGAQKCWAHLLRKAIRLALLYPRKKKYQRFLDELLGLYRDAKRAAADGRLGAAGRQERVTDLENRLCGLCLPYLGATSAELPPPERDFRNLVNELTERLLDEELFTFVLHPEVEPTNNVTERLQRGPALDRKAGRTSKTAAGAGRRSVIVSVLESLRANLETFTLSSVLEAVQRWMAEGVSLFARQWEALLGGTPAPVPDTG
ncbi:MAG TPA: transposase [Streptosporangiaceae bacterium]|nr:transposase [Streptosporangiaceae bacterium]